MKYEQIAQDSRLKVLDLVYKAQSSHIGSLFSCADIFAVLFENIDLDKDKFVLSAGWKACMLYYHLWRKGRITLEELDSYCQPGSKFIGLAEPIHPDIQIAGGSMGFGLPGAVGIALAKKIKGEEGKVYCLMSDGEQAIGTTWESALIAAHHKLDNLVVIVDNNGFQAMGKTSKILDTPPDIWHDLGWKWDMITGHDYMFIEKVILENSSRPKVIIAQTVKGKGVSFMENNNLYHYKNLSEEEYERAKTELQN
jgi:transketolase